jgi:hypothetical protein
MDNYQKEKPPDTTKDDSQNPEQPDPIKKVMVYKADKKPTIAEWMLIVITFMLFVCNVIIIFTALNQTKSSHLAAQSAADAVGIAQKNVDLVDAAMRIDNRAYIVIEDIGFSSVGVGDISIYIGVKNCGKTPAYNVGCVNKIKISYTKPFFEEVAQYNVIDTVHSKAIGGNSPDNLDIPSDKKFMSNWQSIGNTIFVFGVITYKDIFGTIHYTQFNGKVVSTNADGFKFKPIGNLNKAN